MSKQLISNTLNKILGKHSKVDIYSFNSNQSCFGCGTTSNVKQRFTGGEEGVLCKDCYDEAVEYEKQHTHGSGHILKKNWRK